MATPLHSRNGLVLALAAITLTAALGARIAAAHHSVGGEFNVHQKLMLTGVVSKVDWANPHIYLHFMVQEASGAVSDWRLEAVPVAMMRKAGLTKALLLGNAEKATVDIHPARDGTSHLGYLLKITYADGHHYQFGVDTPTPQPGPSAPARRSP